MAEDTKGAEYWRWTESRWTSPDVDPKAGEVISAGVDVGSVSTQAVVMVDGKLYAYSNMRTGSDSPESANNAIKWALEDTGLTIDDLHFTVGTGYGRVNVPFANKAITEIACHARGGNFMYGPSVRTILDMGGQDCKAIHCDEKGKVKAFLMNDKCAAGTGRGMEVFADLLGVHINEVGEMSLQVEEDPPPVSSTCVVFAKSEASGLLREGWPKENVLAAYCSAMAHRVVTLLERIGAEKEFAITGGIAKNQGVVDRLAKELDITPLKTEMDTQIAGAVGAALFARTLYLNKIEKEIVTSLQGGTTKQFNQQDKPE
jgi:bzd-type benzoyl-CoA reductase Q subunit